MPARRDPVLVAPVLVTHRARLRPVERDDVPTLRAMRAHPEVRRWWHDAEPDWPDESFEGAVKWAVELAGPSLVGAEGALVGYVQAWEDLEAETNDVCGIDVFLAASVHRRGLGREVVAAVRDWLVDVREHHLVQIDPAIDNHAAIACYAACGFDAVGVLPRYERDTDGDGWHDTQLMAYLRPGTP